MLEAYGVTESNWLDATHHPAFRDLREPAFVGCAGRGARYGIPDAVRSSGQVLSSGQLGKIDGFTGGYR
jgi:hypothetical protein